MKPTHIELHLNTSPDFVKRYGKRVKAAGGRYSRVNGYVESRYVTVPVSDPALIDDIAESFPGYKKTVSIVRGDFKIPSRVAVHYVPNGHPSAFAYTMEKFQAALAK